MNSHPFDCKQARGGRRTRRRGTHAQTALKSGTALGGKTYPVSILVKDSQSNPNPAGEVASDLILKDKVDIMLVSGSPETANPVCDACELNETPCVSTVVPWQPWFFGRKGDPKKGFNFTYHFFWGLEDVISVYTAMWQSVQTNKTVGGLFPNDGDGNAWGDAKLGFPPVLTQKGFTLKAFRTARRCCFRAIETLGDLGDS
ncbi:hypothetical protein [Cupriavidus sp. CP313]